MSITPEYQMQPDSNPLEFLANLDPKYESYHDALMQRNTPGFGSDNDALNWTEVYGTSGQGKTLFVGQQMHRLLWEIRSLRRKEFSRLALSEHLKRQFPFPSFYHLTTGDQLAVGRKVGTIINKQGEIEDSEYNLTGEQVSPELYRLAEEFLPRPGEIFNEEVQVTARRNSLGEKKGVDRGGYKSSRRRVYGSREGYTLIFFTTQEQREKNLAAKDDAKKASQNERRQVLVKNNIEDDRSDDALEKAYTLTGDRKTAAQQDNDVLNGIYVEILKETIPATGYPEDKVTKPGLREFRSKSPENWFIVEGSYYQKWLDDFYGDKDRAAKLGIVFGHAPLPPDTIRHVYGADLDERNVIRVLQEEARRTQSQRLVAGLRNLSIPF